MEPHNVAAFQRCGNRILAFEQGGWQRTERGLMPSRVQETAAQAAAVKEGEKMRWRKREDEGSRAKMGRDRGQ